MPSISIVAIDHYWKGASDGSSCESLGLCDFGGSVWEFEGVRIATKITRGSMWLHLGAKGVSKSGFLCAEFRGCPVLVSRYGVAIIVFRCDSERAHAKLDLPVQIHECLGRARCL